MTAPLRLLLCAALAASLTGCATTPRDQPAALQNELGPQEQAAFVRDYCHLLLDTGRLDEAERLLEQLRQEQPADLQVLRLLAQVYERHGKLELALLVRQELHRQHPDDVEDAAQYARVALLSRRYPEAEAVYQHWLANAGHGSRQQVMALNNLGYSRLLQDDAAHAGDYLRQALAIDPLDTRARTNLALALDRAGDHAAAARERQRLGVADGGTAQ